MIKLIVTDMDGTFLNTQSTYDQVAFEALKVALKARGIYFAFVTGKQCERVEAIVGHQVEDTFVIGDSATRIKQNGEMLTSFSFSNALGQKVIQSLVARDPHLVIIACTYRHAYVKANLSHDAMTIVRGSYEDVVTIDDFMEIEEDFVKITVYDANANCFDTAEALKDFKYPLYIVASEARWIDITDKGVTKGDTLRFLQQYLGVTQAETVAFGDGYNDVPLLEAAGLKVVMDNGFPDVKALADIIAPTNDRQGVLKVIAILLELSQNENNNE